jgi:hypothetical protein
VRIDRSDLGDEPDDAHMAGRAWSTRDDPDAAGKDQGNAGRSDGSISCPVPAQVTLRELHADTDRAHRGMTGRFRGDARRNCAERFRGDAGTLSALMRLTGRRPVVGNE